MGLGPSLCHTSLSSQFTNKSIQLQQGKVLLQTGTQQIGVGFAQIRFRPERLRSTGLPAETLKKSCGRQNRDALEGFKR